MRQLDNAIVDIIRKRWKQKQAGRPVPDDILERVLDQVDKSEYGAAVETQLCFEIKTFLLAGHETSAAMLTWTVYELSRNEEAMSRVVSEAGLGVREMDTKKMKWPHPPTLILSRLDLKSALSSFARSLSLPLSSSSLFDSPCLTATTEATP